MAASGADSIAVDECMPLGYVGHVAMAHGIGFSGNLRVSAEMGASLVTTYADAQVCMAAGSSFPGYVFGLGGPLPNETPRALLSEALRGKEAFERTYPRQQPDPRREPLRG